MFNRFAAAVVVAVVLCAAFWTAEVPAQSVSLQQLGGAAGRPLPEIIIYPARTVVTLDPARPTADAVAVIGDRIAGTGTVEGLVATAGRQRHRVDETFADLVLVPGFIEHHVHPVLTSLTMTAAVVAIEDWDTADGPSTAVRDEETYYARLAAALAAHDGDGPFVTWGYHHYFHGDKMSRQVLDEMAGDTPAIVWHRSAHEFFVNTAAMQKYGLNDEFFGTFSDYEMAQSDIPRGHFYEQGAIKALERLGAAIATPERMKSGLEWSEGYYLSKGITTAAEPGGFYSKPLQDAVNAVYADDATPFNHYFIADGKSFAAMETDPSELVARTREVLDWGEGRVPFPARSGEAAGGWCDLQPAHADAGWLYRRP